MTYSVSELLGARWLIATVFVIDKTGASFVSAGCGRSAHIGMKGGPHYKGRKGIKNLTAVI